MSLEARDWIEYHARNTPDKTAMIDLMSKRNFSYKQTHERVARVSGFLKSKGIKSGDRVAFLCLNTTDVMELIFGCWRIGAVCLALNFRLTPNELAYILNDSEASLVLVDKPFENVGKETKLLTNVTHWIDTDGLGGDSSYERGISSAKPIYEFTKQSYEDQCLLMYSSGTTGMPKGVIITHGMLEFTISSTARLPDTGPHQVSLNNMPLFHIGGLNVTALPSIAVGGTCVIMRMFDPSATLNAINDPALGINLIFMVPAAYNAMKENPEIDNIDFSRLITALCGAETVPVPLCEWWLEKGVVIQEGYGLTETAAGGTFLSKEYIPQMIGSAGKPLLHTRVRIVDNNGNTCADDISGEIWFKGNAVTPGYWRNPEANKKSFVDGWFRTGDIGRMDSNGFVFIEDRLKDMYISGGENVYPAEIENLLYAMSQIHEVAVIGVKNEKFGETGCVCAVLKKNKTLTLEEILNHLDAKLANYKKPKYLHIMNELPRGGTGKVLKYELRKSIPQLIGL